MDHELKRRLIGASVLISLAIIFLPMILEHEPLMVDRGNMTAIPEAPDEKFNSSLIRDEVPEPQAQSAVANTAPAVQQVTPQPKPDVVPETTVDKPVTAAATPAPAQQVAAVKPVAPKPVEKPAPAAAPKEVAKAPPAKASPSAWVIQVGSFSNRDNAQKLVQRLRSAGLDTLDPQQATVKGKQLYRVKVGPELDKRNAEKLLPKVKQAAGLQGKVIRYP